MRRAAERIVLAAAAGLFLGAPALSAQSRGSRDLELGDPAYETISHLRERGYLDRLNPLVQPYHRLDIVRALAALGPDTLAEPVASWVRSLRAEFAPDLRRLAGEGYVSGAAWGFTLRGSVRAASSQSLDVLRPTDSAGAWPRGDAAFWVEAGPFSAETRLAGDTHYRHDPDGLDPGKARGAENARLVWPDLTYLAVQLPFVRIDFGTMQRNWGPSGSYGLMVSDHPYAFPQLGFEASVGRFALRGFTGQLDTLLGAKRYLSAHRLDYSSRSLTVSVGESILYGGPGASPALNFLNPFNFLFFAQEIPPTDELTQNLMLDAQFWYRRGKFVAFGEGLLDDFDIRPPTGQSRAPTRYAFHVGARAVGIVPRIDAGLSYEQVSGWAYRTNRYVDQYLYLDRGIGTRYDDYDLVELSADAYPPVPGLRITPVIGYLRQGEGNILDPIQSLDAFRDSSAFLLGVAERVTRVGVRGRYQPTRFLWASWDVGANITRNAKHISGANETKFSGLGEIGVKIDLPW